MMRMATSKALTDLAARASTSPEACADAVLSLQTADKFRLAALLLDAGNHVLAETVGTRACQEIQLAKLFFKQGKE